MRVVEFQSIEELSPYAEQWDGLAGGVPFRSWAWISCWWRHYGEASVGRSPRRLFVLGLIDTTGRLIGAAPWYWERRRSQGRVLRWLGSGEICSDYLSLLCHPSVEDRLAEALADHLCGEYADRSAGACWDLLDVGGVDAADRPVARLIGYLAERGCLVDRLSGVNCWRVEAPPAWDDYLAMLSKGHRKQLRRLDRDMIESGRAVLHTVERRDELPQGFEILTDLHQRRRQMLGQPGCFASTRFAAFHREVMPRLLANGQLQLHWLEIDGRPAAAEYHLAGGGIAYAYQGGVDPAALEYEPGRLITLATLRRWIEQGGRAIDFLRGDEPYKAHFRAVARPSLAVRIVPNQPAARLRHSLWMAGRNVKRWMKS